MAVQWDDRLISQAEALQLAGAHPVEWQLHEERAGFLMRCRDCRQSCGLWTPGVATTADDMLAGVLRHLVMAHDMPLNKAARKEWERERDSRGQQQRGGDGGEPPAPRRGKGRRRPGPGAGGTAADTAAP
jgi:hypothetical protein